MRLRKASASVTIVALCFVAVLGIALASYLAVSNQAMKLSNRNYAKDVSRHLAEMGIERALRSFSFNTFSSWTLSGITASETLTTTSSPHIPTSYGSSGIVPSVNIRVDHYLTTNKSTIWNSFTTYAANDFVWYQGVWYLCILAPTANQAPSNTTYWTAAPEPWNATANYQVGNIVIYGGAAYRCIVANTSRVPPNTTFWTPYSVGSWNSSTAYAVDDTTISGGVPYRCIAACTNQSPPNTTYWLSPPVIYSEGVVALSDSSDTTIKTQLRAFVAPAALFPNALGATTMVTLSSSGTVDSFNSPLAAWNSAYPYQIGDVVRVGTTYYRCTAANTNATPPNASYWTTTAPLGFSAVIAGGETSSTAVSITSANVGGYVAANSTSTAPYAAQASFGVGSVPTLKNPDGSVTSPLSGTTNVDLTRVSRSPYIPQFDVQSVTGGTTLPNGTNYLSDGATTLGTAGASTPAIYNISGTWNGGFSPLSGLYLSDSTDILTINGPVILNVTGQIRTVNSGQTSGGRIVITSTGSLEIYFTGQLYVGMSNGTSGIQNQTLDPKKCILVGTSTANTSSSHYFWATDPFYGVIYMPNAYVSTWTNVVMFGAISAKNIIFPNSGGVMHYDTSLRSAGKIGTFIDGPYVVSELRELIEPTERITMP